MTCNTPKYKAFAKAQMLTQGEDIKKWSRSENPLLSQTCKEILEAAGQG